MWLPIIGSAVSALSSIAGQSQRNAQIREAKNKAIDYLDQIIPGEDDIMREVSYARRAGNAGLATAANTYGVSGRGIGNRAAFMGAAIGPYASRVSENILNIRDKMNRYSQFLKLKRADITNTPDPVIDIENVAASGLAGWQFGQSIEDSIKLSDTYEKWLSNEDLAPEGGDLLATEEVGLFEEVGSPEGSPSETRAFNDLFPGRGPIEKTMMLLNEGPYQGREPMDSLQMRDLRDGRDVADPSYNDSHTKFWTRWGKNESGERELYYYLPKWSRNKKATAYTRYSFPKAGRPNIWEGIE